MRARRLYDGKTLKFDYKDLIDGRKQKNKTLLKMKRGPISFETSEGTKFWKDHPFQWVSNAEADELKGRTFPEFVVATVEQVEDYYAY